MITLNARIVSLTCRSCQSRKSSLVPLAILEFSRRHNGHYLEYQVITDPPGPRRRMTIILTPPGRPVDPPVAA
jgi:hypothetical protein